MQETFMGGRNQTARRSEILNLLETNGAVKVTELSELMDTSVVTIRKDLADLEQSGLLKRVHGGAIKNYFAPHELAYTDRKNNNKEAKQAIAEAAAALVKDGESLIVNVGSTCSYVCEKLKDKKDLIIITNALPLFNEIAFNKNITPFFLGGRFDPYMQITVGDDVMDQLSKYTADKVIMGMDGIDPVAGATSFNHVEDFIMRQMIAQAKERILVVDDSKIGKVAFTHIANLTDFNIIVTNYNPDKASIIKEIERLGLKVITV